MGPPAIFFVEMGRLGPLFFGFGFFCVWMSSSTTSTPFLLSESAALVFRGGGEFFVVPFLFGWGLGLIFFCVHGWARKRVWIAEVQRGVRGSGGAAAGGRGGQTRGGAAPPPLFSQLLSILTGAFLKVESTPTPGERIQTFF